jgi:uroporphyrinogen-III synthase
MNTATVVLTRPLSQCAAMLTTLQTSGRKVVHFPMFDIAPLRDETKLTQILPRLSEYALVVFVSPAAIRMCLSQPYFQEHAWPKDLAIAVMGAGSRATLHEFGISSENYTVISPSNTERTDSETLLDDLDLAQLQDQKVLLIRGETGRELFADALRQAQIAVDVVAAYRRVIPEFDSVRAETLRKLIEPNEEPNEEPQGSEQERQQTAWVITSSEVLSTLLKWASCLALPDAVVKMQQQKLFVPHFRIAQTAKELGFHSITLTASGDENLLVALQLHHD